MEKKGIQDLVTNALMMLYRTTRTSNRPSQQRRRTSAGLVSVCVDVEMMDGWTWEKGSDHRLKREVRREG